MAAAGAPVVRSFDEEVRSIREQEARVAEISSRGGGLADSRKIDILQDWLKACEMEREREES